MKYGKKMISYATIMDSLENEIVTWQYHIANDKIRGEQQVLVPL